MSVTLDKCTATAVHVHVGHNTPGYLPESDVLCLDSVADAIEALRHDLKDQQELYYEGCALLSMGPESLDVDVCECGWCEVAGSVEAALSSIADGDLKHHFLINCYTGLLYSPPEGPNILYWMTEIGIDRRACDVYQDQEK